LAGGRVEPFDGDMDDYRTLLLSSATAPNGNGGASGKPAEPGREGPDRKEQRRLAADRRRALAPLKQKLSDAERAVHRLEAEKASIAGMMGESRLYQGDPQRLVDLQKRLGQVEKQLAAAEDLWLLLHEEWDEAHAESP
jgi:ATP-binding cassette subfamily F protein 3